MVWLYRSPNPEGRRWVISWFKWFLPLFATRRGMGGRGSVPCDPEALGEPVSCIRNWQPIVTSTSEKALLLGMPVSSTRNCANCSSHSPCYLNQAEQPVPRWAGLLHQTLYALLQSFALLPCGAAGPSVGRSPALGTVTGTHPSCSNLWPAEPAATGLKDRGQDTVLLPTSDRGL